MFRPDQPNQKSTIPTKSFAESVLPTGGAVLGGYAGPIGTGLGYSIGDSLREMIKQMRAGGSDILAETLGKAGSAKLTPYAQQRTEELGMTGGVQVKPDLLKQFMQTGQKVSDQPTFSYAQAMGENIQRPENLKAAGTFIAKNVGGAVAVGLSDFAIRKVTSVITEKLLPKINPKLGVDGIKPSVVSKSAKEAADEVWKPIQETLESTTKSGKVVDVTDAVTGLQKRIINIENTFGAGKLNPDAKDEIAGIQTVIDSITDATSIRNGKYILNPKAAQKVAGYFGKQTFSPISKLAKVTSDIENSAELAAKQMASPKIKSALFPVLESGGLKDAASLYKDWGTLINLSGEMARAPLKGALAAGIFGGMTGAAGAMVGQPWVGAPAGIITFLSMTPFGQQLLRELIKAPIKATPTVARVAVPSITEKLSSFIGGNK